MAIPTPTPHALSHANTPVPLWRGRVHLVVGSARTVGDGAIALELSPEPSIAWTQESANAVPGVLNGDAGRFIPWGLGRTTEFQRTNLLTTWGVPGPLFKSRGFLPGGLEVGSRERIASLVFHVVNFPTFVGSPLADAEGTWAGRTAFGWNGWAVDLDQLSHYRTLRDELRATDGYALTHVGRLTRSDGAVFSVGEGMRCLEVVRNLLGFVRGGWCGPALFSGRDRADREVWQHWSVKLVDSAKQRPSIFVGEDPEILARLAPGFMRRATGRAWGDSYRRAVAFYIAANRGVPIEIGIILAQSALELLAWSTYVRSGRVVPSDFERWSAGRRIRQLLKRAKIPAAIPPSLSVLTSMPGVAAPHDGPETVAYVRNRIVHPPRSRSLRRLSSPELISTWRLMLWYTDLLILRLAGYSGTVRSRVDDEIRPVPWP